MCPICLLVAREAVACACGALFCEECRAICSSCPNCRSKEAVHPAFRDRRAIQNLMVGCPLGCPGVFRLGDHSSHVQHTCVKRPVPCPACNSLVALSEHATHQSAECVFRQVTCEECQESVTLAGLATHKKQACSGIHVECSLCGDMTRKDRLEAHLTAGGHLTMMLERLMGLEKKVEEQQQEILTLRGQLQQQQQQHDGANKRKESASQASSAGRPANNQGRPHPGKYMVCGSGGCSTHERFLNGHCDPLKRMNGNKPVGLWSCCGLLDRNTWACATRPLGGTYPLFSWKCPPAQQHPSSP